MALWKEKQETPRGGSVKEGDEKHMEPWQGLSRKWPGVRGGLIWRTGENKDDNEVIDVS